MDTEETKKIEKRWRNFKEQLGYSDEELAIHRSFPKHIKALEGAANFAKYKIVIEVIESQNCGMGYKVGDRFVVNGDGALLLDECPPQLCIAAIAGFKSLVDRMWQAFYDGKTEVLHDTVTCPDVGVRRGGWGEITMRVQALPKARS